jgi:hypothetical protein
VTANDLLGRLRRLATRRDWPIKEVWGKGSHLKVWLNGRRTVIPCHRGDIPDGTFGRIKKDLGLADADLEV